MNWMSYETYEHRKAGESRLLFWCAKFLRRLYVSALNSCIGRLLTDYRLVEEARKNGRMARLLHSSRKRNDRFFFRLNTAFSRGMENSCICHALSTLKRGFMEASLSSYGFFFMFYGIFSIISFIIASTTPAITLDLPYLIFGGMTLAIAIPLMISRRSLAAGLRNSSVFRPLLTSVLGIEESRLSAFDEEGHEHQLRALCLALAGGAIGLFVTPFIQMLVILLLVLTVLVWSFPETGLLLCVSVAPLLPAGKHPTAILTVAVGITVASFAFKLISGKRVLHVELLDIAVAVFGLLLACGGISVYSAQSAWQSAGIYFLLLSGYFMMANLVRSEEGIRRISDMLLAVGTCVSLFGIAQYFFFGSGTEYLDLAVFSDLRGRAYATWENPNMLAEYLALLLPFAIGSVRSHAKKPFAVVKNVFCCMSMTVCLMLTWTRGAWIGVLIAVACMILLCGHRPGAVFALSAVPLATVGWIVLPEQVIRRFSSIGLSDSSVRYRVKIWESALRLLKEHWMSGIGIGEETFATAMQRYAVSGVTEAAHAHSVYLQLLCSLGVVGLLSFFAVLLLFAMRTWEFCRYTEFSDAGRTVICGAAGIFALLIMGAFDEIFYNFRVFFLFWAMLGFVVAQIRIWSLKAERMYTPIKDKKTQSEITLRFL